MENCNTCPSNPKNKVYNYQVFNNTDPHDTTNKDDIIIEGNENATKYAVDEVASFNKTYLDYLLCSEPNKVTCSDLSANLLTKTTDTSSAYMKYADNLTKYNACNDPNDMCETNQRNSNNAQAQIVNLDTIIKEQTNLLSECNALKLDCKQTKEAIKTNQKLIDTLTDQISKDQNDLISLNCDGTNTGDNKVPDDIIKKGSYGFDANSSYSVFKQFFTNTYKTLTGKSVEYNEVKQGWLDKKTNVDSKQRIITDNVNLSKSKNAYQQRVNRLDATIRRYRSWWYRRMRNKLHGYKNQAQAQVNSANSRISANNTTLNQPKYKSVDVAQAGSINTSIGKASGVINDNNVELNLLNKQRDYHENRQENCENMRNLIDAQTERLDLYKTEQTELKTKLNQCQLNYENKCSTITPDVINKNEQERDKQKSIRDVLLETYATKCKQYRVDCSGSRGLYDTSKSVYDNLESERADLEKRYNICINPEQNICKDKYKKLQSSEYATIVGLDVAIVNHNKEGLETLTLDTHKQQLDNVDNNNKNYAKLKASARELDNYNNGYIDKNAIGTQQKMKNDRAIYTNVLLTTLATSLLYYVFIEL